MLDSNSREERAFFSALYEHRNDEPTYEQQERIRAYVNGTDDQYEDGAVIVRKALYGTVPPKDIDAFCKHDPFMDDDFDGGGVGADLPRSYYPVNWAGNSSYLDRDGKRHSEHYFEGHYGVLCIVDGHILQLWDKGKIISEVDRWLE